MIDKKSDNWHRLPLWLKCWFSFNVFSLSRPRRDVARRIIVTSHASGFVFCALGFVSEAALFGGLLMLASAYLFQFIAWQADRLDIWYAAETEATS